MYLCMRVFMYVDMHSGNSGPGLLVYLAIVTQTDVLINSEEERKQNGVRCYVPPLPVPASSCIVKHKAVVWRADKPILSGSRKNL